MQLFDVNEFQNIILECVTTNEIDYIFNSTMFSDIPESKVCKQAMIHGMIMASILTCKCKTPNKEVHTHLTFEEVLKEYKDKCGKEFHI